MIKVMFVCHGNICRSPMAEFVFKDLLDKAGISHLFKVESSAVSFEEIGNPVYPPARSVLASKGISCAGKRAVHFEPADYDEYDYILVMDQSNMRNILRITGGRNDGRIRLLLSFAGREASVSDPWYTGDFDTCYDDIFAGCTALLSYVRAKEKI
ncbi:MAG: low molecular weight phosphotyrosine protein phosphatase [Clostridia bacterium]|nr:low molecular weight phosphotyrosine protein phosphatase [Clostridia bacterium]